MLTENTTEKIPERLKNVDLNNLGFGAIHTDHMFIATFENGSWNKGEVVPFSALKLSPFALCFHYGQTVFEGMKAYRTSTGKISIFRPLKNFERINKSLHRMAMPELSEELFMNGLTQAVEADRNWVPSAPESSLYLRPFVIATEERLGVKISDKYIFMVVCCPVGAYYPKPIKVKVEQHFTRAANGGTGYAKCGGNYGASFLPFKIAKEEGFDQIIWTDAINHEFVEESGTMNLMFFIDGVLTTPPVSDTILNGVTRDSILTLAREEGMKVSEEKLTYKQVINAIESGKRVEAFGAGTAAVIAPIQSISADGKEYKTYVEPDAQMFHIKKRMDNIKKGLEPDIHNWNLIL